MTGIDEAKRPPSRSPAGLLTRPLRPYAEIFEIPGAWRFSVAGVIGRMPMSMFGLGTVLLISAATGKYGVAGAVSAVGSLGYAFASPRMARLMDSAVGASVVGFVIDAHGPRVGYAFAALCGVASAATCLAGLRRLRSGA